MIVAFFALLFFFQCNPKEEFQNPSFRETHFPTVPSSISTKDNPFARNEYELNMLVDPKTNQLPPNIFQREQAYTDSLKNNPSLRTKETYEWLFSGPTNVGGRTRALALDVKNENIIIAGGVSGGMWRSTTGGSSWQRTSHPTTLNSATCLVQDTRPGKEHIWYHGTGELRGSSASANGAPYRGDGIFKSVDSGQGWQVLPATSNGRTHAFDSPFRYVWQLAVNHTKADVDEIYAAVFGGIIRSQDGGETWHTVLGDDLLNSITDTTDFNGQPHPQFTNIMITPKGTLYAAIGSFTSRGFLREKSGIFRSTNGTDWVEITPSGFPDNSFRTVMDVAPSNERTLYFVTNSVTDKLWKYEESADFTTVGVWRDLSENLPDFEEDVGDFETQNSYNMVIKVHPSSESIVFLGGTNLYRSTDGFSSGVNTAWIGGYEPGGGGTIYPGHYADQHEIIFYPSDPNKMLSANDGGIRLTNNNLAAQPFWTDLNNGYITSQFYTIAQDRVGGSQIAGGMQDNGSYLKNIPDGASPWNKVWPGDGGYTAFTDNNLFMYFSFQNGRIFRVTLNNNIQRTSFARVDPEGGGETPGQGYLFINPYVLDHYNSNRMYLAGGDRIWRNNNLSQIIAGQDRKTSVNWTSLSTTRVNFGVITALAISRQPAHRLYYGTTFGELFKLEDAHEGIPTPTPISQNVLSGNGYIICIAIDPMDADHLVVVFSNYNVRSIFRSLDGGSTFTSLGGNLEEMPDGTGSGPSVRWVSIVPLQDGNYRYFAGTSTGLYSTVAIDGEHTQWHPQATESIGSAVVPMMDYRPSDGRLVVATHGNGTFETYIHDALLLDLPTSETSFEAFAAYPNPFSEQTSIPFSLPSTDQTRVDIFDTSGKLVRQLYEGPLFKGDNAVSWDGNDVRGVSVRNGMYIYRIAFQNQIQTGKLILNR